MIIIVGVAGAGKSSQCALLKASGRYQWLSVGQLLRDDITDPQAKQDILDGKMLSDDTVITMVDERIKQMGDSPELVLDGYPRTVRQVDWLMKAHDEGSIRINHVVHLEVAEEVAYDRLLGRGRSDDYEQAISERFSEYRETIWPIIKQFESKGVHLSEINGEQPIDTVHRNLLSLLEGSKFETTS